jgi:hypothetical protein
MFNICPSNTKLIIKTPSNKLIVIPLINYQYNLLAVKKLIQEKLYIQIDQQKLSFCNEEMIYDHQGIDMYHRYFHQKYEKCMYMLSIKLNLKY